MNDDLIKTALKALDNNKLKKIKKEIRAIDKMIAILNEEKRKLLSFNTIEKGDK